MSQTKCVVFLSSLRRNRLLKAWVLSLNYDRGTFHFRSMPSLATIAPITCGQKTLSALLRFNHSPTIYISFSFYFFNDSWEWRKKKERWKITWKIIEEVSRRWRPHEEIFLQCATVCQCILFVRCTDLSVPGCTLTLLPFLLLHLLALSRSRRDLKPASTGTGIYPRTVMLVISPPNVTLRERDLSNLGMMQNGILYWKPFMNL